MLTYDDSLYSSNMLHHFQPIYGPLFRLNHVPILYCISFLYHLN